jgi:hypothetical protein
MLPATHAGWTPPATPPQSPEDEARRAEGAAERDRVNALHTAALPAIAQYRAAAHLARKLYAPPIALLIRERLEWWSDLGHRFESSTQTATLYAQVMADARAAGLA